MFSGVAVVVIGFGWWGYSALSSASKTETRYVLGIVEKGTIISSVSASGQVSASNQLDVKPKVSGTVISVGVQPGQYVKTGTLIAQIDATDAVKSVRDAKANLESAQISFEKLNQPASALTLTQAQNALSNAQDSLTKLYSDSHTHVINAFLDLPSIMTGIEGILIGEDIAGSLQSNMDYYENAVSRYDSRASAFQDAAYNDYTEAKKAYDTAFTEYQLLGDNADNAAIEQAVKDAYLAVQLTAKATKSANALVQLYVDVLKTNNTMASPVPAATTALSSLNAYTSKLNSHVSTLLSDTNAFKQYKQSIVEKQQSLEELNAGADVLDIRSARLSLTKAQNTLTDAQNNLAEYYVRAPFDGTIASVDVKKYDTAGSGTALATLITSQRMAELSLNEVDAAKIKVGNKVTLTFDAIDELTLTGKVAEVDAIGVVSQGVVSYTIKIGFDSQDERIKPGMTVNAAIIVDVHQDVLIVPSSAVKTQNGTSYVLVLSSALGETGGTQGITSDVLPTQVEVIVGLSDDTNIEIMDGLSEGDQIVVKTSSGTTTKTTTTSAPSLFGGGGNAVRTSGSNPVSSSTRSATSGTSQDMPPQN